MGSIPHCQTDDASGDATSDASGRQWSHYNTLTRWIGYLLDISDILLFSVRKEIN